jgi:cell division protein FtsI/penicillin-binding protein 2
MMKITCLLFLILVGSPYLSAASLYDQSMREVFQKRFASPPVSYLLLDAQTGALVAAKWENAETPVPAGSLVKPFTALAYGLSHNYRYPQFTCRGTAEGCWLPRGHGRMGIREAIGNSCNAYFRQLAEFVRTDDLNEVMLRFGIEARRRAFSVRALVGLGEGFEMAPEGLARAFTELAGHAREPGVAELLEGMSLSARAGTASAIERSVGSAPALAKTGTAPCVHSPRAPGDGFVIVLYPADAPRFTLMVRVHGVPGSHAAIIGGEMLRTIVTGR